MLNSEPKLLVTIMYINIIILTIMCITELVECLKFKKIGHLEMGLKLESRNSLLYYNKVLSYKKKKSSKKSETM